jgi:uncharacterized protein YyaL (SSP411 family)
MNNLRFEKSPYLLQHAKNPVNWHAWNDKAFDLAASEDKPIFLSIGYSTCHWCHVMAHESFENEQVADLMNKAFVNIKVDREERPDIDSLYMTVCTMMTGSGGWPLTIIMTPEKEPFYAGTYFPRETQYGRMGMVDLIPAIQEVWINKRDEIITSTKSIIKNLQLQNRTKPGKDLDQKVLAKAYHELAERYDQNHGGFGNAPKFPSPHSLIFLLRNWGNTSNQQSLQMVEKTLTAMRMGGIYDHIGFGFHRYSTDANWLLPHFEKMLYDQALLALAYLEAYQITGKALFKQTAEEIFTYVLRDMTDTRGGFYSAEDADSEGEEGKFYVWQMEDIRQIVPSSEIANLTQLFNLQEEGNFHDESTGQKTGANIFHLTKSIDDFAAELDIPAQECKEKLEKLKNLLFDERTKRIPPHKDDKILADWNGMMIAALAMGSKVLNRPDFLAAARQAAGFVLTEMRDGNGRLLHRHRDGESAIDGLLDDYAYMVWGLIELYQASFTTAYLQEAVTLNALMLDLFWDNDTGGFFLTAVDTDALLVRQKEIYDGAIPSGNSIALCNLLRLGRLTGDTTLDTKAKKLIQAFSDAVIELPSGYTQFLNGVDYALGASREVVVVGDPASETTQNMLKILQREYSPYMVSLFKDNTASSDELSTLAPFSAEHRAIDNKATAYVCRNFSCEHPTNDAQQLQKVIQE